jgi:hypothetical protein
MCMQKISAANSCSGRQDYVMKGIVLGRLAIFWDKQQGVFYRDAAAKSND